MQIRLLVSLLAARAYAATLNCNDIRVDEQTFDLEKLGGPHSVVTTLREPPSHSNTSYTVDVCAPLKPKGDVPAEERCPDGTRVCAIQRTYSSDEADGLVHKVIPIAGNLDGGSDFDYEASRLEPTTDNDREGLRLILNGGAYPPEGANKRKQRAVIDFICDANMEGTENEWAAGEKYEGGEKARRDGVVGLEEGEEQLVKEGAALRFLSYGREADSEVETLRLEWKTKYACAEATESKSASWGFFTWLLIILFMLTAAYLIFGSWLNYTRHGARGWDLVPHGDTIRDVPYLMKDWTRSVLNTVQGSGSRGGYSAV